MTNSDIISICAAIVALLALIATFWQAALTRKHNRLSVKPHIDWRRDHLYGEPLVFGFTNHGLGPAIIESLEFRIAGKSYLMTSSQLPPEVLDHLSQLTIPCTWTAVSPGTPISPNQSMDLFKLEPDPKKLGDYESAERFLDSFGFVLKYRSIYNELYTISQTDRCTKA